MAKSKGEKFAEFLEEQELKNLERYALKSRERRELLQNHFRQAKIRTPLEYRTEYHRDRDRIVWSKSFKRLQHKTQVFPHYTLDHYRRRLTHSLEVAQIATTVARSMRLNETATEAISLGHDLGHPPFGHAGERALSKSLVSAIDKIRHGKNRINYRNIPIPLLGFDHCAHAIETVSFIEREYASETKAGGLNLTFDIRDGILKHMFDYRTPPLDRPLSKMSIVTNFASFKD
jgi:dGTPase